MSTVVRVTEDLLVPYDKKEVNEDPLLELLNNPGNSGKGELAENHDKYLYSRHVK
ncbi:MAG: hypothetical protein ACE5J3_12020 [Methanosarcinales archaeon]